MMSRYGISADAVAARVKELLGRRRRVRAIRVRNRMGRLLNIVNPLHRRTRAITSAA